MMPTAKKSWTRSKRRWASADYERVLARVGAGESMLKVCAEPGCPSVPSLQLYRRRNPDFDARFRKAFGRRGGVKVSREEAERLISRVRGGEAIRTLAKEQGLPSADWMARAIRQDPDLAARYADARGQRSGVKVTSKTLDRVVTALRTGASIRTQTVLHPVTVWRWARSEPSFRVEVGRYKRFDESGWRSANLHRETFVRALRQDEFYGMAMAAVPSGLPSFIADDVRSDLVLGLLTGEIRPEDARAAARRFVSRYYNRREDSIEDDQGGRTLGSMLADTSFDVGETGIRVWQRVVL